MKTVNTFKEELKQFELNLIETIENHLKDGKDMLLDNCLLENNNRSTFLSISIEGIIVENGIGNEETIDMDSITINDMLFILEQLENSL